MRDHVLLKRAGALLAAAATLLPSQLAAADTSLAVGVWANYRYVQDNTRDEDTIGDIADEALIFYADGKAGDDEGNWSYSAELRIGPGSFTDPANNSTGDSYTLHKAWVGFDLGPGTLQIGKSQVPFAWKTVNFWPGDGLQAGYGDQMDVGAKWLFDGDGIDYQAAYYHADDWGETSTDTVDDNGHWGSSTTYRKVQTVVGNIDIPVAPGQTVSFSAQAGRLQDLTAATQDVSGSHNAWAVHYQGIFGAFYAKAEVFGMERDLPNDFINSAAANSVVIADEISNLRGGVELGYRSGKWFWYIDAHVAEPDTDGSTAGTIYSTSPGFSYNYGPGWIYIEVLSQDGFVDRNGQVNEGDFDAFYASMDFYL
ncbi:hypothetical protein GYB61_07380 [bacterium]|nr:hypothetical protein [bacterium]